MTMKKAWSILAAAFFGLFLAFAASAGEPAKTTLTIKGMTCGGCVAAVKVQLKKTEGVTAYDVSLEKGEAGVSYDAAKTTPEKIAESVSKTGFETSVKTSGEKKDK
ncbi:MAG: heavy-metal-associated domain-containing protein [Candidatus Rokuibacteriota bacterium]